LWLALGVLGGAAAEAAGSSFAQFLDVAFLKGQAEKQLEEAGVRLWLTVVPIRMPRFCPWGSRGDVARAWAATVGSTCT
jgi:hypothetical protein